MPNVDHEKQIFNVFYEQSYFNSYITADFIKKKKMGNILRRRLHLNMYIYIGRNRVIVYEVTVIWFNMSND